MCEWCPAHRIPPFEELVDDPPSEGVDVEEARRDYEMVARSLRGRGPALADGTLLPKSLCREHEPLAVNRSYLPHRHIWTLREDRFPGPREKYCTSCCTSLVRREGDEAYTEADLGTQILDSQTRLGVWEIADTRWGYLSAQPCKR